MECHVPHVGVAIEGLNSGCLSNANFNFLTSRFKRDQIKPINHIEYFSSSEFCQRSNKSFDLRPSHHNRIPAG